MTPMYSPDSHQRIPVGQDADKTPTVQQALGRGELLQAVLQRPQGRGAATDQEASRAEITERIHARRLDG